MMTVIKKYKMQLICGDAYIRATDASHISKVFNKNHVLFLLSFFKRDGQRNKEHPLLASTSALTLVKELQSTVTASQQMTV